MSRTGSVSRGGPVLRHAGQRPRQPRRRVLRRRTAAVPARPDADSFSHTGPSPHVQEEELSPPPKTSVTPRRPRSARTPPRTGSAGSARNYSAPRRPPPPRRVRHQVQLPAQDPLRAARRRRTSARRQDPWCPAYRGRRGTRPAPPRRTGHAPLLRPRRHHVHVVDEHQPRLLRPAQVAQHVGFLRLHAEGYRGQAVLAQDAAEQLRRPAAVPGRFEVSIRMYSFSSATGSVIELPPFRDTFLRLTEYASDFIRGISKCRKRSSPHHRTGRIVPRRVPDVEGYDVHGLIRRASTFNTVRLDHITWTPPPARAAVHGCYPPLRRLSSTRPADEPDLQRQPDEIYHWERRATCGVLRHPE